MSFLTLFYVCTYVYIYIFTILCLIHWFYWFWVLEIHIGNILHWTLLSYYTVAYLAGITENCCTNTSYCATLYTTLLLHKNGWNMTCITLKQDRYYKIMAGITCFCCTNRKFFSMRQSLRPHMQYILCTCCLNI